MKIQDHTGNEDSTITVAPPSPAEMTVIVYAAGFPDTDSLPWYDKPMAPAWPVTDDAEIAALRKQLADANETIRALAEALKALASRGGRTP